MKKEIKEQENAIPASSFERSLAAIIRESIRKYAEIPAFSDYGCAPVTYREAGERIAALHRFFDAFHLKKGDRVALLGRNSVNWALVYLATISYGAVIVPILPDFHPEDVIHLVNHSGSLLLFAADSLAEDLDVAGAKPLKAVISLDDFSRVTRHSGVVKELLGILGDVTEKLYRLGETPISGSELASIVYTSGTTGFSKGVMLRHECLAANLDFAIRHMPLEPGDRVLSFLPIAHAFGCTFEFLFPFSAGCHITFLGKTPSPTVLVKAFGEIKPRLVLSVPLIIEKIYWKQIRPKLESGILKLLMKLPIVSEAIAHNVRDQISKVFGDNFLEIVIGGAAFHPEVAHFLHRIRFPYTVGYGMTECAPLITYAGWKNYEEGSVGLPVDTVELRIDSTDPVNIPGEILVRGMNVMSGYYRNPEATRETIDASGWLHTGDLGLQDAKGNVYIRGRSKTMLLGPSGQNIYPEEIEAKLNAMPYVQESLIVEQEDKLVALIYPDMELADSDGFSEEEIAQQMEKNRQELNARLPAYSLITRVEIFPEEFEKTPKRSIKRYLYN